MKKIVALLCCALIGGCTMGLYTEKEIRKAFPRLQRGEFLDTKRVDAGGVSTRYADYGRGPVVLLVHGFPETLQGWRHNVPALSSRFRVLAPDVLGCGWTARPPGCRYSPDEFADHLKNFLDALGIKRACVVGCDTGVAWSIMLASRYPERVEKLVLAAGTVFREDMHSWEISLMATPVAGVLAVYSPFLGLTVRHGLRKGFVDKRLVSAEMYREYMEGLTRDGGRRVAVGMMRGILGRPASFWEEQLKKIRCPVLLVWADEDAYFPLRGGERLKEILGDKARLEVIRDCGHFLQEEKPGEFDRLIIDFLTERSGGGADR